jgi:hypothetical protein
LAVVVLALMVCRAGALTFGDSRAKVNLMQEVATNEGGLLVQKPVSGDPPQQSGIAGTPTWWVCPSFSLPLCDDMRVRYCLRSLRLSQAVVWLLQGVMCARTKGQETRPAACNAGADPCSLTKHLRTRAGHKRNQELLLLVLRIPIEPGDGSGTIPSAPLGMYHFARVRCVDLRLRTVSPDPSPALFQVVLWMTGGPGCSSGIALFNENGPCKEPPVPTSP